MVNESREPLLVTVALSPEEEEAVAAAAKTIGARHVDAAPERVPWTRLTEASAVLVAAVEADRVRDFRPTDRDDVRVVAHFPAFDRQAILAWMNRGGDGFFRWPERTTDLERLLRQMLGFPPGSDASEAPDAKVENG